MSETYTIGGDTLHKCDDPTWGGQTFRPIETHVLEYIDLEMRGTLQVPEPVILVFQTGADHKPWGAYISRNRFTIEKNCSILTTGRVRFSMQPCTLTKDAYYCIVVSHFPPFLAPSVYWQYDAAGATYPRGMRISTPDSGATWIVHHDSDHIFAEFGTPPLPKPDPPPPIQPFAVITSTPHPVFEPLRKVISTSVPCHLTCYWTDKKPLKHAVSRVVRGLGVPWYSYYCFVDWHTVEQEEAGDTLYHTFIFPGWTYCQTRWFTFRGEVDFFDSPSVGPIFKYHHPGPPPFQTEEQTSGILWSSILDGAGWGQKLNINNRVLSQLSFYLKRVGNPAGYVGYWIRKIIDDSLIWQRVLMNSNLISTVPQWYDLDIVPPILINEEVRIVVYATGGSAGNLINIWMSPADVKAGEHAFFRYATGVYTEYPTWDFLYKYVYQNC